MGDVIGNVHLEVVGGGARSIFVDMNGKISYWKNLMIRFPLGLKSINFSAVCEGITIRSEPPHFPAGEDFRKSYCLYDEG